MDPGLHEHAMIPVNKPLPLMGFYLFLPEWDTPHDDIGSERMIRGTITKIKDGYAGIAVSGRSLSAGSLNGEGVEVTHFPPFSAAARTFSGGYAA